MIDFLIELGVNAIQSVFFIGFLYLCFDKKFSPLKNIISLTTAIAIYFVALYFITFHIDNYFINDTIQLTILISYSLTCLKGNKWLRILMSIVDLLINGVISLGFSYVVTVVADIDMYYLVNYSSGYRYFCMLVINLLNIGALWIILALFKHKEGPRTKFDFLAYLLIPLLAIVIICSMFLIISKINADNEMYGYFFIMITALTGVTVFAVYLINHLGKQKDIEKQLALSRQRENLYLENTIRENNQLQAFAKAKHEINNKLDCIYNLQKDRKYDEASELCRKTLENIASVYVPVDTDNPLLNAIINSKLEKASKNGISLDLKLGSCLPDCVKNYDIITIIGNLCDNAIEYLTDNTSTLPRVVSLSVKDHQAYYIIKCCNPIEKSVLVTNPDLKTTKSDTEFHGIGINTLKEMAKKYKGHYLFTEKDNYFIGSVMLLKTEFADKQ